MDKTQGKGLTVGTGRIPDKDIETIHFVGIGGSGMSSLAELALSQGMEISGSDVSESRVTRSLTEKGIIVYRGHAGTNLGNAEAVVYSSAIQPDNPELLEAEKRGLPLLHRSDLLNMMMKARTGLTVAGTHGKSTVTAMLATILKAAGESPSMAAGAFVPGLGGNFLAGEGRFFIAEADESDRSFLKYEPFAGIITNIDSDHLDNYRDLDDIKKTFLRHLNSISKNGAAVCCLDDPNLEKLLPSVLSRVITYGLKPGACYTAADIKHTGLKTSFSIFNDSRKLGDITLPMPGEVNVLNALAASALSLFLGIDFTAIRSALNSFTGLSRRMEFKGEIDNIWVMDDYGHHPTEIKASLEAFTRLGRRIVLIFQPHRYSRTEHLMLELADSFSGADELLLLPVYSAGERPKKEGISELLAREIFKNRPVTYFASKDSVAEYLKNNARPGDLIITMGAGDVWKIGEVFLEEKND